MGKTNWEPVLAAVMKTYRERTGMSQNDWRRW